MKSFMLATMLGTLIGATMAACSGTATPPPKTYTSYGEALSASYEGQTLVVFVSTSDQSTQQVVDFWGERDNLTDVRFVSTEMTSKYKLESLSPHFGVSGDLPSPSCMVVEGGQIQKTASGFTECTSGLSL